MAPIIGTIASDNIETYSTVPDIANLRLLEPSEGRFLAFLTRAKKQIRDVKKREDYGVQERRPRDRYTTLSASYTNSASDNIFSVADASFWTPGDIYEVPTRGEQGKVNSIDYTNKLLYTSRGVGTGKGPFALTSGDYIHRTSRNFAEGYSAGSSFVTATSVRYNNCETIATPVSWTKDQLRELSRLSPEARASRMRADQKAMGIEHVRDVNRACLFHYKSKTTMSDGRAELLMDGLVAQCGRTYDHVTAGFQFDQDTLLDQIYPNLFINGNGMEKFCLCGLKVLGMFSDMGLDSQRFVDASAKYKLGFPVSEYHTPNGGTIILVHEPEFDQPYWEYAAVFGDWDFVRYGEFSSTEYQENIGEKRTAARLDQWQSQPTVEVTYTEMFTLATNLKGEAA